MTDRDALYAVSPLDGRYAGRTEPLVPYASEAGLMRARLRVEVAYLLALADLEATPITADAETGARLESLVEAFDEAAAQRIKAYETEGYGDRPATNHDVKAVEYYLRDALEGADRELRPWVHFGLTSEDVNNLAQRLLVGDAVETVLLSRIGALESALTTLAREHRSMPMLAHTHGQPATPTTFGKEMAVYAARLGDRRAELGRANERLAGKLAGASGSLAAHHAAYPDVDWQEFSAGFVRSLGLAHRPLVTQVNPCDDLAALFRALAGINGIVLDLDRDCWAYISRGYLGQAASAEETGSSTMPHKVNPIDFENSEGNAAKAIADLEFLADYITRSRLQRDLSDSTVKRTIGGALAHCLLAYDKTLAGLETVVPRPTVMADALEATPAIIGEAVQTILRREGDTEAYERVKALSRGQSVTLGEFRELFDSLDIDEATRAELNELEPTTYTGVAHELVDEL